MFCSKCGSKLAAEAGFCSSCGNAVTQQNNKPAQPEGDDTVRNATSIYPSRLILILSAIVGIMSSFLPWIDAGQGRATLNMFQYFQELVDASLFIVLIAFFIPFLIIAFIGARGNRTQPILRRGKILSILILVPALLFAVDAVIFNHGGFALGIGAYAMLLACIGVIVASFMK